MGYALGMDEFADLAVLWPPKRLRYRVAITMIDTVEARATVALYDTNSIELSQGPQVRDPASGQLVQDVLMRLVAAVRLHDDHAPG